MNIIAQRIAEKFAQTCRENPRNPQLTLLNEHYVYTRKGEILPDIPGKTDPDCEFLALQTGIYKLAPVTRGNEIEGYTWLHFGDSLTFETIITQELTQRSAQELKAEWMQIIITRVLQKKAA